MSASRSLLVALLLAGCLEETTVATDESALLDGTLINDEEAPWSVYVLQAGNCNGVILSPRWILTAAHCVNSTSGIYVAWRRTNHITGQHIEGNQTLNPVTDRTLHPQYNDVTLVNDIALLHLTTALPADPMLAPAELPNRRVVSGEPLLFVSTLDNNEALPATKLDATTGTAVTSCGNPTQRCMNTPTAQTCNGDSGSGVIRQAGGVNYVAGLVSQAVGFFDQPCGNTHQLQFTDVVQYLDWIQRTMGGPFDANFRLATQLYTPDLDFGLPSPRDTLTGDFDGDGKTDYVRLWDARVFTYWGASGTAATLQFTPQMDSYGVAYPPSWQKIVGDFNGDHIDDYALLGAYNAHIFYGGSTRRFSHRLQTYSGLDFGDPSQWQVAVGDFNGDGKDDYVRMADTGAYVFSGTATYGTFTQTFEYYGGLNFGYPSTWQVIAGDFNGDGKGDYARLADTGAWIFYGTSSVGWFTQVLQSYPGLDFGPLPSSWEARTGDFDGDGRTDYARVGGTGAWIYYGNAKKTFTQAFLNFGLDFGQPSSHQTLAGDFDGDGRTDLARIGNTTNYVFYGKSTRGSFGTLFHALAKQYGLPTPYTTIGGDFNGDGKADFARLAGVFADTYLAL